MLFSLGKAEVKDIIEQEGEVAVTCEFCNECYCFDLIDIEQLFLEGEPVLPSTTTH
jgi:molecular chaperone Hsp33